MLTQPNIHSMAKMEEYPEEMISEMISTQFISSLSFLKSGKTVVNVTPHLKIEGEKAVISL